MSDLANKKEQLDDGQEPDMPDPAEENLPPVEENDDDMLDLEQSSKRQRSTPVFSSDMVLAGLPTLNDPEPPSDRGVLSVI